MEMSSFLIKKRDKINLPVVTNAKEKIWFEKGRTLTVPKNWQRNPKSKKVKQKKH